MSTSDKDTASLVIRRLRNAHAELEIAARPEGEFILIRRQDLDAVLDDIGGAECLMRTIHEGV